MNMSRIGITLGLISIFGVPSGCRRIEESPKPAQNSRLSLIYSGSLDGEIEPCG